MCNFRLFPHGQMNNFTFLYLSIYITMSMYVSTYLQGWMYEKSKAGELIVRVIMKMAIEKC